MAGFLDASYFHYLIALRRIYIIALYLYYPITLYHFYLIVSRQGRLPTLGGSDNAQIAVPYPLPTPGSYP